MHPLFDARRAEYVDITHRLDGTDSPLSAEQLTLWERFDMLYRSLCAILYNYAPTSGHPGGSISSGRLAAHLVFSTMDYDIGDPDRPDADLVSYAAGHKALGLYALWALRNEIVRLTRPELLPADPRLQLRLEDLLGFRRNPDNATPLFSELGSRALDGHPTPATPFVRLSTGASGVGLAASVGLAFGARDYHGPDAPRVHIVEGEGGMTPGRVAEALASAATSCLDNVILHIDWNQASIDSDRVCREGGAPGDYVQWNPIELAYLHDWNVVFVPDGHDIQQIAAAQKRALAFANGQPTAVVYRTTKGWHYGINGRKSHGAGHKLCSAGFHEALAPLVQYCGGELPTCSDNVCRGGSDREALERCLWAALSVVRRALEKDSVLTAAFSDRVLAARMRLNERGRHARAGAPDVATLYRTASEQAGTTPAPLAVTPGGTTTLREELARCLDFLNRQSSGALLVAAADLLGSTNLGMAADGFPEGFFNCRTNPESRRLSVGGICEDGIACVTSGISAFGCHIAACSSYAAFLAPLAHIPARLHALANQMRTHLNGKPYNTLILVCAHASVETGEDGPTHADPQSLQLLQENFPRGTAITLTPLDASEVWPLMATGLARRPAVLAPFVNRPPLEVPNRTTLGIASSPNCVKGVYALRHATGNPDGTIVLQGSGVAHEFLAKALPRLDDSGANVNVYYISSTELFELLDPHERESVYPDSLAQTAMGITNFTLPTMYRWVRSTEGLARTLYPFRDGHYLGSGPAAHVLAEAGLDGESQYQAVMCYLDAQVASRVAKQPTSRRAPARPRAASATKR